MVSDSTSPYQAIITVLVVGVMFLVGIFIFDAFAALDPGTGSELTDRDDLVLLGEAGTWVSVTSQDGTGTDQTVRDSRGTALRLTGANDSYAVTQTSVEYRTDQNYTVSTGVWIDDSGTGEVYNVVAFGDPELILRYDGPNNQWQAVWIGVFDTHLVNVSATDPTNTTIITATVENSNLTVWENTTAGESTLINESGQISVDLTAGENLDGVVDETRAWDRALNQSDIQSFVDDPIAPIPGDRTARVMYDNDTTVFHTPGPTSMTTSNTSFTSGFGGQVVEESGVLVTRDYEWDEDGPRLRPESAGRLDGAPAAYAAYSFTSLSLVDRFERGIASVFELGTVVLIIIVLGILFSVIMRMRTP